MSFPKRFRLDVPSVNFGLGSRTKTGCEKPGKISGAKGEIVELIFERSGPAKSEMLI